ncbi:vacuolar-sorting receptor 1 isoform X2 [Carex littledalei]|uniref:Vacuolar-sorting receptor 1 isoform X2 n=1 Tax=Carex littledalei TaxID=544730 RepID=A0A833QIB1_9POAL|nr:vacuolar-sorting receptor 1 isoform X2 [Carex littledalei]
MFVATYAWLSCLSSAVQRCPLKDKKHTTGCADQVLRSLRFDQKKMNNCSRDPEADTDNNVLKAEQDAQASLGDVRTNPSHMPPLGWRYIIVVLSSVAIVRVVPQLH